MKYDFDDIVDTLEFLEASNSNYPYKLWNIYQDFADDTQTEYRIQANGPEFFEFVFDGDAWRAVKSTNHAHYSVRDPYVKMTEKGICVSGSFLDLIDLVAIAEWLIKTDQIGRIEKHIREMKAFYTDLIKSAMSNY